MARRAHALPLVCAFVLGSRHEARASTCFAEPHTLVFPTPDAPAPRNTRVRVRLRHGPLRDDEKKLPCEGPLCDGPDFGLALRRAGEPTQEVEATRTVSTVGEVTHFELRPTRLLVPNTRYEVYRTDVAGSDVLLLSSFTTNDRVDDTAPLFPALRSATFHPFPPPPSPPPARGAPPPRAGRKVVVLSLAEMFPQLAPYVAFRGPLPSDDGTRVSDLAFFVWSVPAAPRGAAIDYTRPPDAILSVPEVFRSSARTDAFLINWGSESSCDLDTMATPRPQGQRRVGVRVVDLAGNRSEPQERAIDFGK